MSDPEERIFRLRTPVINFFLLGLVVFGLKAWFEKPQTDSSGDRRIEISSADIDWYLTLFRKRMGREPALEELQGHVNQLVRERVLSAEARRLGLNENDDVIRRRLAQKMDYLFRDSAAGIEPSDEVLERFLSENSERYELPGSTTFLQVFFSPELHGEEKARQLAEDFVQTQSGPGDPTILPEKQEKVSPVQVRGIFGDEFSRRISGLGPGKWSGPLRSSYGFHAVLIEEQIPPVRPSVNDLRERLTMDWLSGEQARAAAENYGELRGRYQVLVEGMPYSSDMQ
jgi:hypothetical protein